MYFTKNSFLTLNGFHQLYWRTKKKKKQLKNQGKWCSTPEGTNHRWLSCIISTLFVCISDIYKSVVLHCSCLLSIFFFFFHSSFLLSFLFLSLFNHLFLDMNWQKDHLFIPTFNIIALENVFVFQVLFGQLNSSCTWTYYGVFNRSFL